MDDLDRYLCISCWWDTGRNLRPGREQGTIPGIIMYPAWSSTRMVERTHIFFSTAGARAITVFHFSEDVWMTATGFCQLEIWTIKYTEQINGWRFWPVIVHIMLVRHRTELTRQAWTATIPGVIRFPFWSSTRMGTCTYIFQFCWCRGYNRISIQGRCFNDCHRISVS